MAIRGTVSLRSLSLWPLVGTEEFSAEIQIGAGVAGKTEAVTPTCPHVP